MSDSDDMNDFIVNSDSGSDFEASPPPAKKVCSPRSFYVGLVYVFGWFLFTSLWCSHTCVSLSRVSEHSKQSKKSPVAKAPAKKAVPKATTTKTAAAPKKKDAAAPAKPKAKAATTTAKTTTTATKKRKVVDSEDDDDNGGSDDDVIRRDASSSTVENHNIVDLDDDPSEADSDAAPAKKKAPAKPKAGPSKSASDTYQKVSSQRTLY